MSHEASKVKREATSIKIRPDLWKEAKIEAVRRDMDLSELVEKAIEAWLKNQDNRGPQRTPSNVDKLF